MVFDFLFKQPKDAETDNLMDSALQERGPVFLLSDTYKHTGTFLDREENFFYISHGLSREEVFAYLKGRKLRVQISSKGQLYEGQTELAGLGLKREQPALRLENPKKLIKNDPRKAIRLSTIGFSTSVSFCSDERNIIPGRIIDISMTGAAIRPNTQHPVSDIRLSIDCPIHTDIQLESGWSISTLSRVKNFDSYKIGIEFGILDKKTNKDLYKYIQKMRRTEVEPRNEAPPPVVQQSRKESTRPCIIIFGQNEDWLGFLKRSLARRYEIIQYPLKISEIRNRVHLEKPKACLLEIPSQDRDSYRQLKKLQTMLGMTVPCMFFTENLPKDHMELYFQSTDQKRAILDLAGHQTLRTFKTIESFIGEYA